MLDGGNYKAHENGSLEIFMARKEDQGIYTCVATNILGKAEAQVRLEVKGRGTKILDLLEVAAGIAGANTLGILETAAEIVEFEILDLMETAAERSKVKSFWKFQQK